MPEVLRRLEEEAGEEDDHHHSDGEEERRPHLLGRKQGMRPYLSSVILARRGIRVSRGSRIGAHLCAQSAQRRRAGRLEHLFENFLRLSVHFLLFRSAEARGTSRQSALCHQDATRGRNG